MPTEKIHIKLPRDRLLFPTHVDKKKEQVFFFKKIFLSVFYDQTSVEYL